MKLKISNEFPGQKKKKKIFSNDKDQFISLPPSPKRINLVQRSTSATKIRMHKITFFRKAVHKSLSKFSEEKDANQTECEYRITYCDVFIKNINDITTLINPLLNSF